MSTPRDPTFTLSGTTTTGAVTGVGTVIGWQTAPVSASGKTNYCTLPSGSMYPNTDYDAIMGSGDAGNSGQFIEVESDAWSSSISSCGQQLQAADGTLVSGVPSTATCNYPP
jgi:hypothetical protein